MDDQQLTDIGPVQSSTDKLDQALEALAGAEGDPSNAFLVSTAKGLMPMLRRMGYIPDDPAELDQSLLACARWCLGMRSDNAWQPDTIDDLFLGPEPATDSTAEPAA